MKQITPILKACLPLMLFLMMALAACAPALPVTAPQAVANTVVSFTDDMRTAYMEAANVYSAHVALDSQETKFGRQLGTVVERMKSGVKDQLAIMKMCYTNTDEFFVSVLTKAYGDKGIGGQDTQPYINLLQLGQTFPDGGVTECQKQANEVLIYLNAHGEETVNIKNQIFAVKQQITQLEMGDLKTAVIIEFYKKYSGDMKTLVQNGDQAFAKFIGSQSEDQRLPADFLGFPTGALQAETHDMKICKGYQDIADGVVAPPAGKYRAQYGVSVDTVTGICQLTGSAADGYYTAITTPSQASMQDLENGCTSVLTECEPAKP